VVGEKGKGAPKDIRFGGPFFSTGGEDGSADASGTGDRLEGKRDRFRAGRGGRR
jgi:hypothetical protein